MKRKTYRNTVLLLFELLIAITLFAGSLTYDKATGQTSGFDLTVSDSPNTTSSYTGTGEVWTKSGFVGRLVYTGEPTTMTFSNTGPVATQTTYDRFYFTYNTSGSTKTNRWQEFFLVTRVKGLLHSGSQDDFSLVNYVVGNNNGSISISKGAGTELVSSGQQGYNTSGQAGTYDGSNSYKYKYPYQYIWIDVTLIRTNYNKSLKKGYYESQFTANTTNGLNYTLQLTGEYNPNNNQTAAESYYFGVQRVVDSPFPFTDLSSKNSSSNALTVGQLRYLAENSPASVGFASNSLGTATDFQFTSVTSGVSNSFTYYVVYDGTIPNENATTISSSNTFFDSDYRSVVSPISGGSTDMHVIEGDIKIFVPSQINEVEATYTSIIYCILTMDN
jgi:hypothetical protein